MSLGFPIARVVATLAAHDTPHGHHNVPAIPEHAGALLAAVDFPAFVANLIHGTFQANLDVMKRQTTAFEALLAGSTDTTPRLGEAIHASLDNGDPDDHKP